MNTRCWNELEGDVGPHLKPELDAVLASKRFYPYIKDHKQSGHWPPPIGDKELVYCCYGALDTDTLYGTLTVDDVTHYAKQRSPVAYPVMEDRLFGMDRDDSVAFNWLTDMLCSLYIEGKTKEETLAIWDRDWNARYPDKAL